MLDGRDLSTLRLRLGAAVAIAVALAAAGAASSDPTSAQGAAEVSVELSEFVIETERSTAIAGEITFVVSNVGSA